ncbi:mitochondrial carrier protein [Nitzschia inconspicua]|uniref:Mitochondrial carrier protein n=1 Tax=Nitzschia inconspicua TaxID=303405 RepID=A0A9K3M3T7_9STRA|nr:mitochondrial carrier protein [Nitzschia inconspicua]KAG7373579.1 mitochondrial carrier protein [Nitzschia inconspicua]
MSSSSSTKETKTNSSGSKKNPLQHLIAGGCAGLVESSVCHPLDTIKTRMQLRKNQVESVEKKLQHSLVEPALRLKHSLQEPALRLRHSLQDAQHTVKATPSGTLTASLRGLPPQMTPTASKVSVQLNAPMRGTTVASLGPIGTAKRIVQREGFFALYKGLTAVYTGIIPKMAIRFVSFEQYKDLLNDYTPMGRSTSATFTAGLMSGLTEAVLVVTPAEVCKIRMQSQHHSLIDATQRQHRKYRNVFQTAMTIVREEGLGALYKGVVPTMLRQGCNQACNFTAYNYAKRKALEWQQLAELPSYQSLIIGGLSGGLGPICNNPLDVVKTRLQKQVVIEGKTPKYTGLVQACMVISKEEGVLALWKGITPRLLRIMPGQAITFMTYEFVSFYLHQWKVV